MIAEISIDSVFVDMDNLHDCSFLNEKKIFALGPGVFEGVAEDFSLFEEALVLMIKLIGDGKFVGRIIALIKEEIIVLILVIDAFLEEVIDLLQVG